MLVNSLFRCGKSKIAKTINNHNRFEFCSRRGLQAVCEAMSGYAAPPSKTSGAGVFLVAVDIGEVAVVVGCFSGDHVGFLWLGVQAAW